MNVTPDQVLSVAMKLPPEARAAVAARLIESLDDTVDEDAEALWSAEIARRLKDLDEGRTQTIPWEEARRRILGE